jgi:hypothetical protein
MMKKIADCGGIYSKTLDPSCTHLVIAQPVLEENESVDPVVIRTSKVDWALRRNAKAEQVRRRRKHARDPREEEPADERMIMIVWEGWFWDCVEFNGRFPEDRWRLENQQEPPPPSFSAREMGEFVSKLLRSVLIMRFMFYRTRRKRGGRGGQARATALAPSSGES